MKYNLFLAWLFVIFMYTAAYTQQQFKIQTIAFYNVENLFDTHDDPDTYDDVKTEEWYTQKLKNLEKVLLEIGTGEQQSNSPVIIGVCEVENRKVLEDLVRMPKLASKDYAVIHFDSPDGRGIDVGFLYQKKYFTPTSYINIPLRVRRNDDPSKWLRTRDQLLVTGLLDGEEMHFIVNHWPSRSGGEKRSSPYREAAGALNKKIIDSLQKINPDAKIITMGDLNDGPFNKSVKKELKTVGKKADLKPKGLYNPMEEMSKKGIGTLAYRDSWDLFDQMILSEPFLRDDYSSYRYWKAGVFNKPYLIQPTGQYKGYPLRNTDAVPGYSDHFPVYVYLIKQIN